MDDVLEKHVLSIANVVVVVVLVQEASHSWMIDEMLARMTVMMALMMLTGQHTAGSRPTQVNEFVLELGYLLELIARVERRVLFVALLAHCVVVFGARLGHVRTTDAAAAAADFRGRVVYDGEQDLLVDIVEHGHARAVDLDSVEVVHLMMLLSRRRFAAAAAAAAELPGRR